ncbi:MAG: double-strand break repair helicase AddA [Rhodospirillaceae bacterium]|nr:double-strand break repair helicase AddA [Rhodospirillaceae bacterium]
MSITPDNRSAIDVARSAQREAINPRTSAWVSASAGSGKTTVLTNRVLALMLGGAAPERILCLTFTKAAAAEMANRIAERLGKWVTADESALIDDVAELLTRAPTADDIRRARRLFAHVLDAPGGMRIETIHAFCQSLLRRFPVEAGLSPQFELMDERTSAEALTEARDGVVAAADPATDPDLAAALAFLTGRLHETRFPDLIAAIAQQRAKLERLLIAHGGIHDEGLRSVIRAVYRRLRLAPAETSEHVIAAACAETSFDAPALKSAMKALGHGTKTDIDRAERMGPWLAHADQRVVLFDTYCSAYLTQAGTIQKRLATKDVVASDPNVLPTLEKEAARIEAVQDHLKRLQTAEATTALLTVAERMLRAYRGYKRARSLLDYDDLIQTTRKLLQTPGVAAWVLYKLDGGLDHVLIDEAQDTNPDQWDIVTALTDEFFTGEGRFEDKAKPETLARTVFAVGDRKQSIYSFQGADLSGFDRQYEAYGRKANAADRPWRGVQMNVSFRTTAAVLKAVDLVFERGEARPGVAVGAENIAHIVWRAGHAGRVEVWPPVAPQATDEAPPWKPPVERTQGDSPQNRLALLIARRINKMIVDEEQLPARGRAIRAGDIMVLVRRRTSFVDELVRQLKALSVPVAGVDRMVLPQQLAVMDLIALGQFLLLPSDDLTLACILKSPLIGLDEDALFTLAYNREPKNLWESLSAHAGTHTPFGKAHEILADLLARTDYLTPFALFSHVVVAHDGRKRALGRLGYDADDPIDEFLSLALAYEKNHPPSLQSFLHWVVQGDIEIKRDLEQGSTDAVRIMTVHGSKGLQAPIIFMPDTMQTPTQRDSLVWTDDAQPLMLWVPSAKDADQGSAALREDAKARILDEYRRLLYVAMTRAEDRLYVCGWKTKNMGDGHWYQLIHEGIAPLAQKATDAFLAERAITESAEILVLDEAQTTAARAQTPRDSHTDFGALPAWVTTDPTPERDPPQPLAPSRAASAEPTVVSPLADDGQYRFQRGLIIHRLLQTLPDVAPDQRENAALRFVARPNWTLDASQQSVIVAETMKVLTTPEFAPLFAKGSLAEVPVVGLVGRHAVSGQVDRLTVTDTDVWIIDYKTNRPPPREVKNVDAAYVFQMAVYRNVLQRIYPQHHVRCVLLWTDGPYTMEIPPDLMDTTLAAVAA